MTMVGRLTAAALMIVGAAASAQVPPDVAARIRAIGPVVDASTGDLYSAQFPASVWNGVTVERDIAYGGDALQKLDVLAPAAAHRKLPVLLFVHAGGFTRGDKHTQTFYPENIPLWAVRHGMVGVNINYRLAPANPWPAGLQDLASAIAWTKANIARYGGDPNRIVLFGHSAGANHVGDYAAHAAMRGPEAASVKGVIMLSPFYAASPPAGPNPYYGSDAGLQTTAAQIERLRRSPFPLFLGYAEYDPPGQRAFGEAMAQAMCMSGRLCRAIDLKDHNHFSEGMALGTPDQSLAAPLLDWMKRL